jgi:hypothetical protein
MEVCYGGVWHGFTFNPDLRRLSDYRRLGSYSGQKLTFILTPKIQTMGLLYEAGASKFYYGRGYRGVVLDETGCVRHIGDERHVADPGAHQT